MNKSYLSLFWIFLGKRNVEKMKKSMNKYKYEAKSNFQFVKIQE